MQRGRTPRRKLPRTFIPRPSSIPARKFIPRQNWPLLRDWAGGRNGRRLPSGFARRHRGTDENRLGQRVLSFCSIGMAPQDITYAGEPTRLEIGDHNEIREFVTINRGTVKGGGVTSVAATRWLWPTPHRSRLRHRRPCHPGQCRNSGRSHHGRRVGGRGSALPGASLCAHWGALIHRRRYHHYP